MKPESRSYESALLGLVYVIAALGFILVAAGVDAHEGQTPSLDLIFSVLPPTFMILGFSGLHILLKRRQLHGEQLLLPVVALLLSLGLTMIYRLLGMAGVWHQLSHGFIPGLLAAGFFIFRPSAVERIRRLAVPISIIGLALPFLTALFGEIDETGVRLSLKLGPLPSIQTSELIKMALILFLAWYIEREGRQVEGRARPFLGWLRMPPLRYFIPGMLFVCLATLALVAMVDYGAVLILVCIFIIMLYVGFETRTFITVATIGIGLAAVTGVVLALTWDIPDSIRYRFIAFFDPWSQAVVVVDGHPTGVTVSAGPGYQIQQSIYAVIAGGISGSGLGLGTPEYVPLAHSDFIFAAILEEMGFAVGFAILALYTVLLLRILRIAARLAQGQVFERLLLIGIAAHLFTQVFIMVSGTLNLLPMTGVTIPFLSQGGTALALNLSEIGIAMAISRRLES